MDLLSFPPDMGLHLSMVLLQIVALPAGNHCSYWIQPQSICCPQFALLKKWVSRLISCHASLRLQVRGQGPSHWRGPGWQLRNFNWLKLMSVQHGIANISRLHQKMCTSFVRSHHFATSIGSKMPASYETNINKQNRWWVVSVVKDSVQ